MTVGSGGTDGNRVYLADDVVDAGIGAIKVRIVAGGSGGVSALVDQGAAGISPWLFDLTDKPARVLGRVGVDLLTDAVGLATDAGLASVFGRLADGTVRVGGTVAVSGPATDAQLRAAPLPVSGPLTDVQLRAAALPVSIAALPLPAGAATEATLATLATDAGLASVYGRLADGSQHTVIDSSALPAGAATSALQTTGNTSVGSIDAKTPALVSGRVPVDGSGVTQPISAVALPLPAGASTEATLAAIKAKTDNLDVALSTRAITGLTDTQLRASAISVVGPVTDAQLRASAVAISAAALPLPAGAAQEHTTAASPHACRLSDGAAFIDPRSIRALTSGDQVTIANASLPVTGTFWQATQPISAAALPLPTGASTEATLALIKAKTDNIDVALSTRAITGLTDAQLRASAVSVSGTVTANIGTTNGLALDATLTGGTQKAIARGGAKGATAAADLTSTAEGVDHQALDVQLYHGGVSKDPTAIRALTAADIVTAAQGAGAGAAAAWACRLTDGAAFYAAPAAAQLPAALVGGRLDGNIGAWLGSTAPTVGAKTSANSIPVVIASDQAALPVTAPVITKGTQGANGFTTQDLKDAGRSRVSIVFQGVGAVADALLSLVKSTNGVAASGATTIAVAANKRLRITSMTFSVKANAAAAAFATFTLRINPAGAAILTSQSEFRVDVGNTEAVVGAARAITIPLPDGFELSGTDQLAVSALAQAITNILSVSLNGFEY